MNERAVAQEEFREGDKVEWNTPQGKTRGTVRNKLTSDTQVGADRRSPPQRTTRATLSRARRVASRPPTNPNALSKV